MQVNKIAVYESDDRVRKAGKRLCENLFLIRKTHREERKVEVIWNVKENKLKSR